MASTSTKLSVLAVVAIGGISWGLHHTYEKAKPGEKQAKQGLPSPVNVENVSRGDIERRRFFSGTLEACSEFTIAPKVGGRVKKLAVDLADPVFKNKVIAYLDDEEYVQAKTQAEAEVTVAEANAAEATSALVIANRKLSRVTSLHEQGIASDTQLDSAMAEQSAQDAKSKMAAAQVTRAKALLETAMIKLGYTQVSATWSEEDSERFVSKRHVNEGDLVSANTPLLTIISLNPIRCVIFVGESDYGLLEENQTVTLTTDAFPKRKFSGAIKRISPMFAENSRQARVEIIAQNSDNALKPGMFVRAEIILDRFENAVIVPTDALTKRGGKDGIFLVNPDGKTVSWKTVVIGIQDGDSTQVLGEDIEGRVVTLGQQLIKDGSSVVLPENENNP